MEDEKKVVQKRTYTVTEECYDDGSNSIHRVNDGFTLIELLGLCQWISLDLLKTIEGAIEKPEKVIRQVIVDPKPEQ